MHILLVEDEAELATTLRNALQRERYVVDVANSLALARESAQCGLHDLVLLDRTLPDGDGLTLIPVLRSRNPGVPVIVLSALDQLPDRIEGLDEGADDYLAKPFALEELFARIRAVRRRPSGLHIETVNVGRLVFDPMSGETTVAGQRLDLPRREIRVLGALARRLGRTVLRESIEMAVYGFDDGIHSNTLDSHVSRLRRKLADADAGVEIHAIRGVGYLMRESK
ncbi:response regulator transcription factor [Stenotrophomonas tumulicola]|uniref:Response regulator transcription factor n=1 Tax=Stenotrophomonas tumulicola TaxID=1685415 RepID=A0A7W3FK99_9GAMM|nr:response regulator transcription factor [Stenotrophomonas tumulicola]MBA8681122.1 response regulator transcription factor [Stenotrophomonas tumulicola]